MFYWLGDNRLSKGHLVKGRHQTDNLKKETQVGEKCQKVLEMWSQNYAMKEIAQALGYKSEGMVRKKKHQCLRKLTQMIEARPDVYTLLKEAMLDKGAK